MLIRVKRKLRHPEAPQRHENHRRPMTRRELIAQGFMTGGAAVLTTGLFSLFANPRAALAQLAEDLAADAGVLGCGVDRTGTKIPFICFDLAGGANLAGSNVLVGRGGALGQLDTLSTAGYSKLGLPGDQVPGVAEAAPSATGTSNGLHADTSLGLAFHSDSAFLRGMYASFKGDAAAIAAGTNGAVIPARSENDTGNNPHNPLYGIQRAGAEGSILTLIGSQNTDSGGNSMAPAMMINAEFRPTKVDRPSDVTGLVGTSDRPKRLSHQDEVAVTEAIYRLSKRRIDNNVSTGLIGPDPVRAPITRDQVVEELVKCGYLDAAYTKEKFGNVVLNPAADLDIVGPTGIFTDAEFNAGGTDGNEFRKTASVMKMVIDGYAGAGCITMGGYDYHGGMRQEGETKDFRAGRCMGAVLAYAMRRGKPVMMYVFSDGSLSSNGVIDNSVAGRGKGEWVSDNQDMAAPFFLVYNPTGQRPTLLTSQNMTAAQHQQLGAFSADGNVVRSGTPGANNVNLLVHMILLNYMALHGEQGQFTTLFPNHGLGDPALLDRFIAFAPIV
ncbi:MAG TPA: hypothetical protein VFL84_10040 [Gammaproteobacteria bacterium]|nr:hypothetical protein [Gammaproteobacteria bacterium]